MALSKPSILMFDLRANPFKGTLSLRPVCKSTDRNLVRELFRREFYDDLPQVYSDQGLWEIYDSMDTSGALGAYLVTWHEHPLLLLEVHPAVQMDLERRYLSRPGTYGIYCFYFSTGDPANLPATRTCIGALLDYPAVCRIVTSPGYGRSDDEKTRILEGCGFRRLPGNPGKPVVFCCTPASFLLQNKATAGHARRSRPALH
jgi:hypothetical protein